MNLDEFRTEMDRYRESVDEEARSQRDSYIALDRLYALFRRFDEDERELADQVLAEWVLSDDAGKRFDAIALIREFGIEGAAPALEQLADRLAGSAVPGASDEREKAATLAKELVAGAS
jgi:hypothetical protein